MNSAAALSLANVRLGSAGDLAAWLEAEGALEPEEHAEVSLRLAEFVTLRASIRELLDASIGGGPFPAAAVERINEASARVPRVMRLAQDGAADTPLSAGPTPLLLARIAWSAIELLGDPDRSPRRCGACGIYFEATRSDRVWCSNACGNRTRVARHHARRRVPA
ncbi:MAG TPA: ABATE domain-containing protein [Actinomycetota bacterium]|nr:ABATE domain-containing protein [Actinomycetota bacterium]